MSTYLHPGVYIEEFAPGAPIEGVGTSTAAFIGVAQRGPVEATRLTSWDAFRATYGEPLDELYAGGARAWLGASVKGFFENGGTACWIVRASSGTFANAKLNTRNNPHDATIVVTAKTEGVAGNGLQITVADRNSINVALGANLLVHRTAAPVNVTGWPDPRTIKVASNAAFQKGDFVTLKKAAKTVSVIVDSVSGTDTIGFAAPLADDYSGAGGTIRTADIIPGTKQIRVDVPAGKQLRRIVFAGSTVVVDSGGTLEYRTVESVGTDSIVLRDGLTSTHVLTADVEIASADFDVLVVDSATSRSELFTGLGMDSAHPSWFGSVSSTLVTLAPPTVPPGGTITDPRPQAQTTNVSPGADDDRGSAWSALESDPSTQLEALEPIDEVAIVAIPGASKLTSQLPIVGHCERMGDRVAVIDPPFGQMPTQVAGLAPTLSGGTDRGFGALYYPWIQIVDPTSKKLTFWPPSAHVAGVYARTDAARGVFKAPANTTVLGAYGVELKLTDADQDLLNPAGVNAFRLPPAGGAPRIFGARTTSTTANKAWMYVNIRRLFNWLEESIAEGIAWAVFEPNDERLWKKLDRTITAFLTEAQHDGAIFGEKPADGFYVRIDEALNPASERSLGRLHIEIGVMPVYPAEFIVVRIGIWDGGSAVTEG